MQQLYVEMYNYKAAWRELSEESRAQFVGGVAEILSRDPVPGLEVLGYAFNDPSTDHRAPYDFFCVYRLPDVAARGALEELIGQSGWYDYFDQQNLTGAAMAPLTVLTANQQMAMPAENDQKAISSKFPHTKQYQDVHGHRMAYVDHGTGPAIVFVHGDIMSSYMWREIMPHLSGHGRLVAVDLIGAGDSDKLRESGPGSYGFEEHARYFDGLLSSLDLGDDIVFVTHDWGANLAFDWTMRNPARVKGIAFNEPLLPPFDWSDWPAQIRGLFELMRCEDGERAVLEDNTFVEMSLKMGIQRMLATDEVAEIVRPYAEPGECRRPTLAWPREVPFGADDSLTCKLIQEQAQWLAASRIPKLHLLARPGSLAMGRRLDLIRSLPELTEVPVTGSHWAPEDDPHGIGHAVRSWIDKIRP